ncbi:hypothetical protein GCM10010211_49040 [Streptomyces albospinus]|uniref:Uncharacterized protein n=2 Tax=Streptomyces TaxID=1883 RepID=A0A117Q4Y1_9ACTN|nr:hypothetical protein [Streptomyces albospinus]KUN08576.1 hypothetical protein AQI95_09480 [Streptomyces yokosukanensis]GGU77311.1 hypothetical protein GCM10010211_49040 [Streptomyces albospinus]
MPIRLTDLPVHTPDVPRDGRGRPLVVPKSGGKPRALTRTTTFIDAIEDKSALTAWGKRMVLVGAATQPSLLDRTRDLDPASYEGKSTLNSLAERAVQLAGAHTKRERGTHLHALSERVDQGEELPASASAADLADMAAYKVSTVALDVVAVETFVVVPELGVAGTFDRMVRYSGPGPDGERIEGQFIADLKTGSVEYGGLKMASQLAVYAHGELYDPTRFPADLSDAKAFARWKKSDVPAGEAASAYGPLPPVNQDWGIVIHLPAGQAECTLYWADLRLGWTAAKLAGEVRAMRGAKGALQKFAPNVAFSDLIA